MKPMLDCIQEELIFRKDEIDEPIESIYFGGGTPSLLAPSKLDEILCVIKDSYPLSNNIELTLEANPEDISKEVADNYLQLGFNRLSLGVQTLNDKKLQALNRIHSSKVARDAMKILQESGFENYSIDMIYGIPPFDESEWKSELEEVLTYNPKHLSVYGLTIEEKTVLGNWYRKRKFQPIEEDEQAQLFRLTQAELTAEGFEQYEVSNYCIPGNESRHNSSYWNQISYIGIGPGAHSYRRDIRSFNVSNNSLYIKAIKAGTSFQQSEKLNQTQLVNEYIMTGSRLKRGIDLQFLKDYYHINLAIDKQAELEGLLKEKLVEVSDKYVRTTSFGLLFADEIALKLFYDN